MLQLVDVGRQSLDIYRDVVGGDVVDELRMIAKDLQGLRVVHINGTSYGGGVSELLRSLVPLEVDLGLKAEWRIISGEEPFFKVTKAIHDGLQGERHHLTQDEKETYLSYNYVNARELNPDDYDIIVVHDPQPAGILESADHDGAKWVWRCHIDTSEPNPEVWAWIKDFVARYDRAVFTMAEFVPADFPIDVSIIPPAIDPLSPKNLELDREMASKILSWLGMFPWEPFITQVSRFDKWKDPFGVVEAYKIVRESVPNIHLAMVGSMALDDPTAWEIYSDLTSLDRKDPNLHVFTNLTGVSNIEVNAFQRLSKAVVQKSIREGFGLVVSEALWKETPVIAGKAGGIPFQLSGGGGLLIDSVEDCAKGILEVLESPEQARLLAEQGRQNVADNFLMTRLARDELALFRSMIG
jgi:trehalose synthase